MDLRLLTRSDVAKASQTITVVTLNVWGQEGDWPARRGVLREGLQQLSPDVVAVQEAIVTPDYDQVADLLPPGYHIVHQKGRSPDGTGCSIASRLPLGNLHQGFLHVTERLDPDHGWIGSIAVVEVIAPHPTGELLLVHLKPSWQPGYKRERELQSLQASEFLQRVLAGKDLPVILLGDFDAAPDAASIRFWIGRETLDGLRADYIDTWQAIHPDDDGHTFTPRNPLVSQGEWIEEKGRRIDYIFVRGMGVKNCSLVFDKPVDGVWASDHFGVAADLTRSL